MSGIKQAEEDVKAGRIRDYSVFLKELKKVWRNIGSESQGLLKKTSANLMPKQKED